MNQPITRAFAAKIDVADGERAVIAKINTDEVDRFGTVIDPGGIDFKAYRDNPVVLWEHGTDPARGKVPVGRNAWIKHDKAARAVVAKTIFHDDAFSDGLFRLYQNDVLRGFSINGLPRSYGPPTDRERQERSDMGQCRVVYRGVELTEYSAVSVPGNRSALALAVSRGLWVPEALRGAGGADDEFEPHLDPSPELPPLVGRRFAEVLEATLLAVRADVARAREHEDARRDLRRGVV